MEGWKEGGREKGRNELRELGGGRER